MEEEIYSPKEDSFFLTSVLEREIPKLLNSGKDNLKVLEIGSGSGIQLQTLFRLGVKKENIFALDINKNSVELCKKLGFNCIQSNLFSKIKKQNRYDLILFNPPYLPKDKLDKKKDTTGGKKGNETINKFLIQAPNFLTKKGKILLLTSSFTPIIDFKGYKKKILEEKPLFFEKLYVWELTY